MNKIVLSLGGSLIVPDKINTDYLKEFRAFAISLSKKSRLIIVCGGGKTCRMYNDAAEVVLDPSPSDLDWMGIAATRLNAELIRIILGEYAHHEVLRNPHLPLNTRKNIIVSGGYRPGNSSDKVAVLLADMHSADFVINLTNVDRVYDKDPRVFAGAKPIDKISWEDYLKITGKDWKPGLNLPFDPVAAKLAMEKKIKVVILDGANLANLRAFIVGKSFIGTIIG